MKALSLIMTLACVVALLVGCGNRVTSDSDIDVDLSQLSSTMAYAEIYSIYCTPEEYQDKIIKVTGTFESYGDEADAHYYCCISDTMECCSQYVEFHTDSDLVFPDDFPQNGQEITVTGVYESYTVDDNIYYRLNNSILEF